MLFEHQRDSVVGLCLQLSRQGYFSVSGGNLMMRLDDDVVAVTPAVADYQLLTAADIGLLRLSDLSSIETSLSPSADAKLHAQVLRRRPELQCSILTHQPFASACALLGDALEVPAAQHAVLGKQVKVVSYALMGTHWLAKRLERAVGSDANAWLIRHRGVFCAGVDSAAAVTVIEQLERLAANHLQERISLRLNSEPPTEVAKLTALLKDLHEEVADDRPDRNSA
ncbi:hypothetical protein BGP77_06900 [Saccharospirillum sp. MSK14-1]|uniref:class II aldolase/adducin family protein n=1 Tax=Saccharospirillum sp. MSK14-1 TaxID=1897632 RepID=UPI000D36CC0A|nr:class II aldolase/adducin family protein [Saccharospirillum sp. MSK14-1]PTY37005.1 hypothetical protein BGP77_06900 [Saccharospirillum sp. MSK14-1]